MNYSNTSAACGDPHYYGSDPNYAVWPGPGCWPNNASHTHTYTPMFDPGALVAAMNRLAVALEKHNDK